VKGMGQMCERTNIWLHTEFLRLRRKIRAHVNTVGVETAVNHGSVALFYRLWPHILAAN